MRPQLVHASLPPIMSPPRPGVCKLICALTSKLPSHDMHWALEIGEGILSSPTSLRPVHSQQMTKAFDTLRKRVEAGEIRLEPRDTRRLSRVWGLLRVTCTAVVQTAPQGPPPPKAAAPIPLPSGVGDASLRPPHDALLPTIQPHAAEPLPSTGTPVAWS